MHRFINFVFALVVILALFPLYTRYKAIAAPIPPGVYLGGLALSDLKDRTAIRTHLDGVYQSPIIVNFVDKPLALRPQDVDFTLDTEQMLAEAAQYLQGPAFMEIALRYAFGLPPRRRDVPVRFTLDTAKLRTWLTEAGTQQNFPPIPPRALAPRRQWSDGHAPIAGLPSGYIGEYTSEWQWLAGSPGYTIDVEQSIQPILAALSSDQQRTATLALQETPAPPPTMRDLQRVIDNWLAEFPGFAAVYVRDLQQEAGPAAEANVDADVSFSGMSTLKLGIVSAVMRQLPNGIQSNDPASQRIGQQIDFALGESNNTSANRLLAFLGGDTYGGARAFTDFARQLGMVNTYMQSGFDDPPLPQLATPGNSRKDWQTNPDSNLQSSPAEMGRFLAALYECTAGKGAFPQIFGDAIRPAECWQILFYMTHDSFTEMIWAGLPVHKPWIVHKHGFAFDAHSDVALVWGPTGPYVISIFLYQNGWLYWPTSNHAMQSTSRLVWKFFEFQAQVLGITPLPPPQLQPPPGYVPINQRVPGT